MNKTENRAVLLFTLDPGKERKSGIPGKRRLSNFLWSVIRDVIESVHELGDTQLFITVGEEGGAFQKRIESLTQGFAYWSRQPVFIPLSGNHFETNLKDSVQTIIERKFSQVAVVANDSPFCDTSVFRKTFDLLDRGRGAVLGPSRDGGLYLLGFRAGVDCLDGIPWKSAKVFQAIRNCLAVSGFSFECLPIQMDIDRFSDLHLVRRFFHNLRSHFQNLIIKLLEIFTRVFYAPPVSNSNTEVWFRLIFQKSPPFSFSK